jgi:predicted Zn-dependent protease
MNRPARILAVVPLVVGLVWLAINSLEAGAAGTKVFEAGVTMRSFSAPRAPQPPGDAALRGTRDELLRAQAMTPRDPAIHELLGLIDARRGNGGESFPDATAHFLRALELRPTSPQTWSDLAAMKYRTGDTGREFEVAIRRAAELGRFEPEVQGVLANYGLSTWSEVGEETRAAVEMTISTAMKRNSLEMLQIAERRGRLEVACHHLDGSTRQVDPKWSQLCQSMEATS